MTATPEHSGLKRCIIHLMMLLLLVSPASAATFDQNSAEYTACAALATSNPQAGLNRAESWLAQTKSLTARHCHAIALFGLQKYPDAATELESLADSVTVKQPLIWLSLLSQAAKARAAAGENGKANSHLSLALNTAAGIEQDPALQPVIIDLLLDRSTLSQQGGKSYDAIQDLDHAIAIKPNLIRALLLRARALDKIGSPVAALIDVRKALVIEPQNLEANGLRRELERKTAGK